MEVLVSTPFPKVPFIKTSLDQFTRFHSKDHLCGQCNTRYVGIPYMICDVCLAHEKNRCLKCNRVPFEENKHICAELDDKGLCFRCNPDENRCKDCGRLIEDDEVMCTNCLSEDFINNWNGECKKKETRQSFTAFK